MLADALLMLKTVFPLLEVQPEVTWAFLQELSDEEVRAAVVEIIRTHRYPTANWIGLIYSTAKRCPKCGGEGTYENSMGYEVRCSCHGRAG